MKMNLDALKTLEIKLAEYSKANGVIAEHVSDNMNKCASGCSGACMGSCKGNCTSSCSGNKR
ncbi:MAG: hypothetical protein IJG33_10780 [Selenomonadaceae bacterium]|nr:hypothetical protein [Selenomonadaceae bacterium]